MTSTAPRYAALRHAALRRSTRSELGVGAAALGVAAGAWVLTTSRMAGMDTSPGAALGGVGWFAVSWLLMMAAMMLPALMPAVIAGARRAGRASDAGRFLAGYLAVWLAAGLVAYAISEAVRSMQLDLLAWDNAGRWIVAGTIAAAGAYQLTPFKDACLRRCREHLTGLHRRGARGIGGALGIGVEHGGFCVGSSWALMAALFALGEMNLIWMAVVAALVATERLLPWPAPVAVALVLVGLAVSVALVPADLPAFTIPGSQQLPMMQMH